MKTKRIIILSAALTGLALLCWYLGTLVTPQELQAALQSLGSWAAVGYIALFTLLPAFFFPVAVFVMQILSQTGPMLWI